MTETAAYLLSYFCVLSIGIAILERSHGVWRSLVARVVRDEEVVGSNPATPTIVMCRDIVDSLLAVSRSVCIRPPFSTLPAFPHLAGLSASHRLFGVNARNVCMGWACRGVFSVRPSLFGCVLTADPSGGDATAVLPRAPTRAHTPSSNHASCTYP